jgi:hypothetical protein
VSPIWGRGADRNTELLKASDCSPNKIEQAIMAIDKIFFLHNSPDMKSIMDIVGANGRNQKNGKT